MKVKWDGRLWRIRFQHFHRPDKKWPRGFQPIAHYGVPGNMVQAITRCFIEKQGSSHNGVTDLGVWQLHSEGIALCAVIEKQYTKEQGRRLSLQRALIGTTRELRKLVWVAYLMRHDYPGLIVEENDAK